MAAFKLHLLHTLVSELNADTRALCDDEVADISKLLVSMSTATVAPAGNCANVDSAAR